jgi:hypothetical protein
MPRSRATPFYLEGVPSRLVVVSVDTAKKTATVSIPDNPKGVYTVPWAELSYVDESQNALRVVREATESQLPSGNGNSSVLPRLGITPSTILTNLFHPNALFKANR